MLFFQMTKVFSVSKRTCLASAIATVVALLFQTSAHAVTTTFFDSSQTATLVETGLTFDTISSEGYLFTYTLDKYWTGGTSNPPGRFVTVTWPDGVQAQAVTTAGPTTTTGPAQITIQRVDGNVFDLTAFTAKLLANTAGAGGAIEVMPKINGEDALANPVAFDATGYYGQSFSYAMPSTRLLSGADSYTFSLYVDFALTGLTLVDASAPIPEPKTYAMMLAGIGLVGSTVARRKRRT